MDLKDPTAPPTHKNSVLLRVDNTLFDYWCVGQYDHVAQVWRYLHPLGHGITLFPTGEFTVVGWREI